MSGFIHRLLIIYAFNSLFISKNEQRTKNEKIHIFACLSVLRIIACY